MIFPVAEVNSFTHLCKRFFSAAFVVDAAVVEISLTTLIRTPVAVEVVSRFAPKSETLMLGCFLAIFFLRWFDAQQTLHRLFKLKRLQADRLFGWFFLVVFFVVHGDSLTPFRIQGLMADLVPIKGQITTYSVGYTQKKTVIPTTPSRRRLRFPIHRKLHKNKRSPYAAS